MFDMTKNFAPRTQKKERMLVDVSARFSSSLFEKMDQRLLAGAKIVEVKLADIVVRDQVRTKFNDDSLKELAANISVNGLIQPLVVHQEADKYVLICGERRFRALTLLKKMAAACYVLTNKSKQELMAIQFSENSSREALHYIDKADGVASYKVATGESERKIQEALGISKSEVHRGLLLAQLPLKIKEAAKKYSIEKYVLLEFALLEDQKLKALLQKKILLGELTKRAELQKFKGKKIEIS